MKIAVVVLFWNGEAFTTPLLRSLRRQIVPIDLVAVDNGSTDRTVEAARGMIPGLRVIETGKNLGFAAGMNVGMQATSAPIVVLLNQDVVLDDDCLERLADAFDDPTVGAVGAKLLYPDRLTLQHAGGYLEMPLALGQHHGYGEIDFGQHDDRTDVEYVNGAVMALRRSALDSVGLLDERFWPGYFEEVDLCTRLRVDGWRVVYAPAAVAVHAESASLGRNSDRYYTAYHRNRLRYVLKHSIDVAPFVRAEAARYDTLGSDDERRVLATVYREIVTEVARDRPAALPLFRRLAAIQPPVPGRRLPGFSRQFHPAMADDFDGALAPLRQSWGIRTPLMQPIDRRPRPLVGGILRRIAWRLARPVAEPIILEQEAFNRRIIAVFEQDREILRVLLARLTGLIESIEAAFADNDRRLDAADAVAREVHDLRGLIGELTARIDEIEGIAAASDSDLAALRRDLAALRLRLAAVAV